MRAMDFHGITDLLKLPPAILSALAVASGAILFLPDTFVNMLYMLEFRKNYGFTLGLVFLISTSIVSIYFIVKIGKIVFDFIISKQLRAYRIKFLKEMSPQHVQLVKLFLHEPTHTLEVPVNDGMIIELSHYGIISPAGSTQLVSWSLIHPQIRIKYFLQPWVEKLIETDIELKHRFDL